MSTIELASHNKMFDDDKSKENLMEWRDKLIYFNDLSSEIKLNDLPRKMDHVHWSYCFMTVDVLTPEITHNILKWNVVFFFFNILLEWLISSS